ncbi:MAG TPA: hypothetical protein VF841_13755 [Anaeromyxobacter sp.]
MLRSAVALLALVPALALGGERTLVVKTFEDARYPPDMTVCQTSGYDPLNIVLGASVWSLQTNAARGEVMNDSVRFLGNVTACGSAPSLAQSPPPTFADDQYFLMRFSLEDGTYLFKGECELASWWVPVPGVLLVGCTLRLVEAPQGVVGGIATSSSVFTPRTLLDYSTGSVWTLHLYTN